MEKLIINNSFKNFRNYRDYRYWPVVVRVRFNTLFKKWSHFGCFPIVWIYPSENRLWEYWGKRGYENRQISCFTDLMSQYLCWALTSALTISPQRLPHSFRKMRVIFRNHIRWTVILDFWVLTFNTRIDSDSWTIKNQIYKLIGEMINWILLLIFSARIDDHWVQNKLRVTETLYLHRKTNAFCRC